MTTQSKTARVPKQRVTPVYLTLDEAADLMSLSKKTIRRRISDGTIPAYKCGRRHIRIRLDELEDALRRIPTTHREDAS
ncbi:DNA-binding protein [Nocardioides seonyuensis]|uniref:DNA-binding protein n=1 Tax=Nocardioides seonyuensis TaxID=2518371 RepID=A0A4P7IM36_9ACTN|nr:helix-turn-helix domain-containing protein [Nocardioides seonyuensis]QBX57321.1 DNA-binding protein [Nocardioides seonyuensis]